jgi:hypothetical protein
VSRGVTVSPSTVTFGCTTSQFPRFRRSLRFKHKNYSVLEIGRKVPLARSLLNIQGEQEHDTSDMTRVDLLTSMRRT